LIDRRYTAAAIWCGVAAVLTALGVLHAYWLDGNVIHELFLWQPVKAAATGTATFAYRAFPIAIGYGLATLLLIGVALRSRRAAGPGESAGETRVSLPTAVQ
jgi:hypothetical protein